MAVGLKLWKVGLRLTLFSKSSSREFGGSVMARMLSWIQKPGKGQQNILYPLWSNFDEKRA